MVHKKNESLLEFFAFWAVGQKKNFGQGCINRLLLSFLSSFMEIQAKTEL